MGRATGVDLLKISVSVWAGYTVVSLDGEGDVTVRNRLCAALAAQAAAGTLVVDLSGLDFIDASCVQVLCRASRMIQQGGGRMGLAAPRSAVARVLELLDVSQVMGVHDSVAKAVIAAGQEARPRAGAYPVVAG
jgi:anti-sigma B factor antagonist